MALCISEGRRQKDRAIRESHEARLLADLDRLQVERVASRRLVKPEKIAEAIGRLRERYPRVARYYDLEYRADTGELHAALRSERRDIAERVDGAYLLKTDRQDLSGEEIWRLYVLLARAENAFRNMKSSLAMRPMFHQIEPRVDTHIFLSVMAYRLLVAIEKTLLDQGVHSSWSSVSRCAPHPPGGHRGAAHRRRNGNPGPLADRSGAGASRELPAARRPADPHAHAEERPSDRGVTRNSSAEENSNPLKNQQEVEKVAKLGWKLAMLGMPVVLL